MGLRQESQDCLLCYGIGKHVCKSLGSYMLTAEKAVNVNSMPVSLLFLSSSLKRSIISVYVVFTVQPNSMVRRLLSSSSVPKFSFSVLLPSPTLRRKS